MQGLTEKRRVLSGMRPTGRLHLGNYMGALYNWVRLQPEYHCFFFIADIHALTTDYADPTRIARNTIEVALDFLSAGLDPEQSTIFVQSHVPQHAELNLLLSMMTPLGWLERVPTYKDQQQQLRAKNLNTFGFLGYPLLQSADILLYKPHFVPVGEDQVSHVELTREVARRFNQLYGEHPALSASSEYRQSDILPEPQVLLTPAPKLPGLDGRKMSKSYGNFISMSDTLPDILGKTEGMSNGGQRVNQSDPGDPERCPVGQMHAIFSTPAVITQIQDGCRSATILCRDCKFQCGLGIDQAMAPIRLRREELTASPQKITDILHDGSARARATAAATLDAVRDAMGIGSDLFTVAHTLMGTTAIQHEKKQVALDASPLQSIWDLPFQQREPLLRDFWMRNALPSDYLLKPDQGATFISRKGKRVLITTSKQGEDEPGDWQFSAEPKSFEAMVLLCWRRDLTLEDFVLPQQTFVKPWTALKRAAGKERIQFQVIVRDTQYFLRFADSELIQIDEYRGRYETLK